MPVNHLNHLSHLHHRNRLAGIPVAAALVLGLAAPAYAGTGYTQGGSGTEQSGSSDQGSGTIAAGVKVRTNLKAKSGASPVTPVDTNWTPPLCWTQPKFSGKEYKADSKKTALRDPKTGKPLPGWDKGKDFHEKDKGAWWFRTYDRDQIMSGDPDTPKRMEDCAGLPGIVWVPEGDPKPQKAISPEVLSGIAFKAMKLPAAPVKLSPAANRQIVNLDTKVKFEAPLDRVWVTATFDDFGVNVAATTVATPVALKIDAGTEFADPQSCTYDLRKDGDGYAVDSGDKGCNVTYRKSSGDGTYPLKAQITWKVTWTDSADPDGPAQQPALPDGLSTFEQDVTVKEIQAINR
ncbi:hypothetical protein ABT112_27295 [Streptomyces sp. NPDC002055]|uniref:hypothetical protein n=1 Tax=Streptomyces sp. NPDC002055 TaxID=3154534 RepID=UPI003329E57C